MAGAGRRRCVRGVPCSRGARIRRAVSHPLPQAGSQPRFHADTRVVVLHVAVTNTHGALVPRLDRDAFKVFENGRPQSITLFGCDDVPVSLGWS